MKRRGIRRRLFVSFLILSILILSLLGSYILWYDYHRNMESVRTHMIRQAAAVEQLVASLIVSPQPLDLDARIKEIGLKLNIRITVIDPDGKVIADSQENPALMENHGHRPEVLSALGGAEASEVRYSSTLGVNLIYAAEPLRAHSQIVGVVRLSMPLLEAETSFNRVRSALLLAVFLTVLLAMLLSAQLSKKFTQPLEKITDLAREMADGNLEKRVHVRTGDEIEMLGHALNNLASSLEDRVNEIVAEKKKLELILQHMDNAVILLDRFGRVTMSNTAANAAFGITSRMIGNHNIQVIGNSTLDSAVHESVLSRQGRVIDLKTNLHGGKRVFQVYLEPVLGNENDITDILCVFHDITALQEIYERQADFIANASHELATPLTAIKGFAETLLDGALSQPEVSAKFLRIIYTEAERMQRLVQDLLQLAKLDSQEYRRQIRLEATPIKPLAEVVVNELSANWRQKNLSILWEYQEPNLSVLASPDWLKQVLVNLIDNSIKYTPDGGNIFIKYRAENNMAYITIQDSGIGIPPKDLPLIFERFYRVDRARTRSAGGTGLGLAIVKFIVETLGGKIEVKSEVDVGTAFTFTLPLAQDE